MSRFTHTTYHTLHDRDVQTTAVSVSCCNLNQLDNFQEKSLLIGRLDYIGEFQTIATHHP